MNSFNTIKKIVFILIVCLGINACKQGNDDAPQNPCKNGQFVSADFTIDEETWAIYNAKHGTDIHKDTTLTGTINFTCKKTWDEYTWTIIGDTTFVNHSKSFSLLVGQSMQLKIRLVVKSNNALCYPKATAYDTVIKTLTIIDRQHDPLYGIYEGYEVSKPNEKFDVLFYFDTLTSQDSFKGLVKGCDIDIMDPYSYIGYKVFNFQNFNHNFCQSPTGWGILSDDGKMLVIDYAILDIPNGRGPNNPIQQKFIGYKK